MLRHKLKLGILALIFLGTGAAVDAYLGPSTGASRVAKVAQNGSESVPVGTTPATPKDEFAGPIAEWSILVDRTPRTLAILAELEKPISMKFSQETPLGDVTAYLRGATKGAAFPGGLPIYVDPQGLSDSDKTMASTVSIELEGIPLKTTLALLLRQLGMVYQVRDGVLILTSGQSDDDPSPFDRLLLMAERGELSKLQCLELREMLKLRLELLKLSQATMIIDREDHMMGAICR
jgi:hypothetical protein